MMAQPLVGRNRSTLTQDELRGLCGESELAGGFPLGS